MSLDELARSFAYLGTPDPSPEAIRFAVADVADSPYARVGKSTEGRAAMLLAATPQSAPRPPIRLRNLSVLHAASCEVQVGRRRKAATYTIVTCEGPVELQSYFFAAMGAVLGAIGATPTDVDIDLVLASFVQLFQAVEREPTHTIRGLWGELLVMVDAPSPRDAFEAWHQHPTDRWDFGHAAQRLEIKTCGRDVRKHHFSLEQLDTSNSVVVIASLQVESGPGGVSVSDLVDELSRRLGDATSVNRLVTSVGDALGHHWRDFTAKFDRGLASSSRRLYWAQDVPTVRTPTPPEVSGVTFVSDLGSLAPIADHEIRALGGLVVSVFG